MDLTHFANDKSPKAVDWRYSPQQKKGKRSCQDLPWSLWRYPVRLRDGYALNPTHIHEAIIDCVADRVDFALTTFTNSNFF